LFVLELTQREFVFAGRGAAGTVNWEKKGERIVVRKTSREKQCMELKAVIQSCGYDSVVQEQAK
jgi:hypothetical protein